jgi:hypothetical protein
MKLHLIEKLRNMRPLQQGSSTFESGDWTIAEERAKTLIGGTVYFHETQTGPSYYGGKITGYRVIPVGTPNAGKIIIIFVRDEAAIGIRTGKDGWGNEQKSEG